MGEALIPDLDIYRTANLLVSNHGQNAPIEAAMRAAALHRGTFYGTTGKGRIGRISLPLPPMQFSPPIHSWGCPLRNPPVPPVRAPGGIGLGWDGVSVRRSRARGVLVDDLCEDAPRP